MGNPRGGSSPPSRSQYGSGLLPATAKLDGGFATNGNKDPAEAGTTNGSRDD